MSHITVNLSDSGLSIYDLPEGPAAGYLVHDDAPGIHPAFFERTFYKEPDAETLSSNHVGLPDIVDEQDIGRPDAETLSSNHVGLPYIVDEQDIGRPEKIVLHPNAPDLYDALESFTTTGQLDSAEEGSNLPPSTQGYSEGRSADIAPPRIPHTDSNLAITNELATGSADKSRDVETNHEFHDIDYDIGIDVRSVPFNFNLGNYESGFM